MTAGAAQAAGIATRVVDDVLGRWTFMEWRPAALRASVESLWLFEGRLALRRERTFPSGNIDIILQLEGGYRPGDDAGADPFPDVSVNGVLLGPHVVESPPAQVRVLGIRVHAAGAHALLGGAVPDLTGTTVDLVDVLGNEAAALLDRCRCLSNEAALLEAGRYVQARMACAPDEDGAVHWVADQLRDTAGQAPIATLAERVGVSSSTLARRFRARTGVTPKRFARIHRFRSTLRRLHADPARSLSALALDTGHYDQSHMNAEFRAMAGLTPSEYVSALRYPGSTSLAESAG